MKQLDNKTDLVIGCVSDTHGMLRPQLLELFQGVDLIIHAGDIGNPEILNELKKISRLVYVRGNMDYHGWANKINKTEVAQINSYSFYILHDIYNLDLDPVAANFNGVIFGHTHKPFSEFKNGVLYLNPGSAGPPRSNCPVSAALLYINNNSIRPEFFELK